MSVVENFWPPLAIPATNKMPPISNSNIAPVVAVEVPIPKPRMGSALPNSELIFTHYPHECTNVDPVKSAE